MHISEGLLSGPVLGSGVVLTFLGVAVGLKKTDYESLPQVAVLASVFFVASLIRVPVGPSAAHLVLSGVCGLILGWRAFPAIFAGTTLQAVLFGFGGLTTLGINTFNMAFPAVLAGFACHRFLASPQGWVRGVAEFTAGAGAVMLSSCLVALSLVAGGEAFGAAAGILVLAHVPVMVMEGVITVFLAEFILRVRPEMIRSTSPAS